MCCVCDVRVVRLFVMCLGVLGFVLCVKCVVYLCLLWLFLECVLCVALCVVCSGRVGLRECCLYAFCVLHAGEM